MTVAWGTSCLNSTAIDLYLFAPSAASPLLHGWQNIETSSGSYNATLNAGWWNYTSPISLEFRIVGHGEALWSASSPAGPLFNATYSGDASSSTAASGSSVAGAVEQVNSTTSEKMSV